MKSKIDELRLKYIICPTLKETETVLLILFSYGFKWRSGCVTVIPKYRGLNPLGNIIYTDYDLIISYGKILKKENRLDNRQEIKLEDFLKSF